MKGQCGHVWTTESLVQVDYVYGSRVYVGKRNHKDGNVHDQILSLIRVVEKKDPYRE